MWMRQHIQGMVARRHFRYRPGMIHENKWPHHSAETEGENTLHGQAGTDKGFSGFNNKIGHKYAFAEIQK